MSKWRPVGSPGGVIGLAVIAIFAGGAGYLIWRAINLHQIDLLLFVEALGAVVLLSLIALVGYWTWGYFSMTYLLDRNGLIISWGGERQFVPMDSVQRIVSGEGIGSGVRIHGVNWPGYHVGRQVLEDRGDLVVYATTALSNQLFVITPTLIYGISPRDPEKFLKEVDLRRKLGMTSFQRQMTLRSRLISFPLWTDHAGQVVLAAAIILNLALFAFLAQRYHGLPTRLPVHFNALGQVDLIGESTEILRMPFIGLIALVVNTGLAFFVHEWDRIAGYLLLAAGSLVQIVLWIAVLNILY
jgi:hypothetical protein